jgi:hypothetical protein
MGNNKTDWSVMAVIITVGLGLMSYTIYNISEKKDPLEAVGDKVNDLKETMGKAYTKFTAATNMTGGSATKRHKKQSKGKGKSHKKH